MKRQLNWAFSWCYLDKHSSLLWPGNTKGGSITVLMTSCLTVLDLSVFQIKTKKLLVVTQLIPNQSNRRSKVQWYFPLRIPCFDSPSVTKQDVVRDCHQGVEEGDAAAAPDNLVVGGGEQAVGQAVPGSAFTELLTYFLRSPLQKLQF
jgi:hypothetical protein